MSQEFLRSLLEHKSIRRYTRAPFPEKDKELLIKVAQSVPSSMHGQSCSIVFVQEEKIRREISELSGGQQQVVTSGLFLVLVMDFFRSHEAAEALGKEQVIHQSAEGLLAGAIDAGIVLEALIAAAEAMGYGTVPIGGIRRDPQKMIELLDLPLYTFPLVGLCVGVAAEETVVKPRLPRKAVISENTYAKEAQREAVAQFDEVAKKYNKTHRNLDKNWSETLTDTYSTVYYPKVHGVLKKQGFSMDR